MRGDEASSSSTSSTSSGVRSRGCEVVFVCELRMLEEEVGVRRDQETLKNREKERERDGVEMGKRSDGGLFAEGRR